jgi:hypothetical protein
MTRNPFINALAASAYVVCISSFLFFAPQIFGKGEDTLLIPIIMLSLFVFSAAIEGYLFLAQPIILFLEGSKKEAISLFLQTTLFFAVITLGFVAILAYSQFL